MFYQRISYLFYFIHKLFRDKSLILIYPRISQDNIFKTGISFFIQSLTHLPLGSFTSPPWQPGGGCGWPLPALPCHCSSFCTYPQSQTQRVPQARPSTAKLPEPRVDLVNIAAPPAKWIRSIGGPVFERAPLHAAQAVWNCGVVLPWRNKGNRGTLPSIRLQGATNSIGVGDGSYSLVVA